MSDSVKAKFTKDEWFKVISGLGQVGSAVVAASPSGVTGLIAEMRAIVHAVRDEIRREPRTGLQEAIATDLLAGPSEENYKMTQDSEGRIRNSEQAVERALEAVRQALWLVDSKTSPEEAESYRHMLHTVALRVAEAAKEGGFLGFGGEQINDKERAVLDRLDELTGRKGELTATVDQVQTKVSPNPDGSGNSA